MAAVIADIYEINQKIGSGGGGIVFLGRHTRLDKKIVLKADKRTLSAGTEKLRREVDLLKGLSHTYIPQVYDFVQEDGIVYTVMDYVEGESLDKILARGETVAQKTIVKWACQLLEALSYLHKQKPHGILHGDIKPANIMLRADGDICLIDFNIALALGEDGAVTVGYSRGYASPEHYGSDRISIKRDEINSRDTGSSERKLLLDARSDLYSLGATLYHLLSGKKPAEKAEQVTLLQGRCSPQIAAIIAKSMDPDPAKRYQSAEEMLDAFLQLRTKDKRVKKNQKQFAICAVLSVLLFLAGGMCTFAGMKQMENYETALKLSSYSQTALADGDKKQAVITAMRALQTGEGLWKAPVPAEAQKALTDALGVYDLSDGFKAEDIVTLPAAPFDLQVSPNGSRYAAVYAYETAVYSIGMREPDVIRSIRKSAISDCLFLNENQIVYAGEQGVEVYDLNAEEVLWTGEPAEILAVSGDRSVVAAAGAQKDHAVLYDASDGTKIAECSFHGRQIQESSNDLYVDRADYIFALDQKGEWLAVSFSDGGLRIFDAKEPENELIMYEQSDYDVFSGGFSKELFAFAAQGAKTNFFGVLDTKEAALIGNMESRDKLLVQADEHGIYVSDGNLLARFASDTLEESELAYTEGNTIQAYDTNDRFSMTAVDDYSILFYDSGANLVSRMKYESAQEFVKLADGYALTANRKQPQIQILRLHGHQDAELFSYDAKKAHSEARVSADGQALMIFDYEGFCTYDRSGNLLAQCNFTDADHIYDQQFIRDGKLSYLEVLWYDGTLRRYALDGTILEEEKKEAADRNLEEEFLTDQYRIVSRLHEPPKVYDKKTGKLVGELEKDDGLAYVTQLDGAIMTEYVSTAMDRYGILLDENLNKLAYLPDLCDVYEDTVVFDYQNGSIRSCSIYSLDELAALGSGY